MKRITIFVCLIVLCACIFAGCECKHTWVEATCESPKTCSECGLTEGSAKGHTWVEATCDTPKTCSECKKTEGEPSGHPRGEWILTKEATLTDKGVEEFFCTVCNESLNNHTTELKTAKVVDKAFNFTDNELIEWANEWLNGAYVIENTMAYHDTDADICGYSVRTDGGEKGVLMLKHAGGEEVSAIMVYFDSFAYRAELALLFGAKISKSFIYTDAAQAMSSDSIYCSANMVATNLTLSSSMDVVLLSPELYMYQILAGTPLSPSDCYLNIEHNQSKFAKYDNNIWHFIRGEYGSDYSYCFYIEDVKNFDLHAGFGELKTYRGITLGISTEMDIVDAYGRDMSFYFNAKNDPIYVVYADDNAVQWKFLEDTKKVLVYDYYGEFQIAFFIDSTGVVDCIAYMDGAWYEE